MAWYVLGRRLARLAAAGLALFLTAIALPALAQPAPGIFTREIGPPVGPDGSVDPSRVGTRVFRAHIVQLPDGRRVYYNTGEITVDAPPPPGSGLTSGVIISGNQVSWQTPYRYDPEKDITGRPFPPSVYEDVNRRGLVVRAVIRFSPDGNSFDGFEESVGISQRDGRVTNVVIRSAPINGRRIATQTLFARGRGEEALSIVPFAEPFVLGVNARAGERVDTIGRIGLYRDGDATLPGFSTGAPHEWSGAILADADSGWSATGYQIQFQRAAPGAQPRLEVDAARRMIIAHWAPGYVLRAAKLEGGVAEIRPDDRAPTVRIPEGEVPCVLAGLSPSPPVVRSGGEVVLTIGYGPDGCANRYLSEPEWIVTPEGGLAPGGRYIEPTRNSRGRAFEARAPGTYQVRVRQGGLSATTVVTVQEGTACRDFNVTAANGQSGVMIVTQQRELYAALAQANCMKPAGWDNAMRRWTSSDPSRATVSQTGLVRAVAPGQVTIAVSQAGIVGRITLEVAPPPPCTSIDMHYSLREIAVGGKAGRPELERGGRLLDYSSPQGSPCTVPPGSPEFSTSTPGVVTIDRATGEVTGVSPGAAAVQVRHGSLTDADSILVRQASTCTQLYVVLSSRQIRVGETLSHYAGYGPEGCIPPPGVTRLSAVPEDLFGRDVRDNLVARRTGTARIFGTHGALLRDEEVGEVTIVSAPNCQSISLQLTPAVARPGDTVRLNVTGAPQPCRLPEVRRRAYVENPSGRGVEPYLGLFSEDNESLSVRGETTGGTIIVELGTLSASAQLQIIQDPPPVPLCPLESVQLSTASIPIGGTAEVVSRTASRAGCRPSRLELFQAGPPSAPPIVRFTAVPRNPDRIVIQGLRGGTATIGAYLVDRNPTPGGSRDFSVPDVGTLRVMGPPCTSVQISFERTRLKPGDGVEASVRYLPEGCTPPPGDPVLTSDNPAAATPAKGLPVEDNRSQLPPTWVFARPGLRQTPAVTITIRHGGLTSGAQLFLSNE